MEENESQMAVVEVYSRSMIEDSRHIGAAASAADLEPNGSAAEVAALCPAPWGDPNFIKISDSCSEIIVFAVWASSGGS